MGYLFCNGFGEETNRQPLHEFYNLSSSIVKVSFKINNMSLGLVPSEKKMFATAGCHYVS